MKVLLAISGGIDSMYLAARASGFFPGASFAVAHCNFGLRGVESDGDEAFVREWAARHGLECLVKRFDTAGYAALKGISIEMAARELRYAWFGELVKEGGFDAVAVAHNANDNAETLLLNLLRGTGARGARGMARRSGFVVRPMLDISRARIRAWMEENGYPWREDSSNAEDRYKRNKLRSRVLPVFEEINPSYLQTLASDMEHFAQVDDIAEDYFKGSGLDPGNIDLNRLMGFRHWRYLLYRLTGDRMSPEALNSLCETLESGRQLAGKRFGQYIGGSGKLIPANDVSDPGACLAVHGPGIYEFKGRKLEISVVPRGEVDSLKAGEGTLLLADADKLRFPFLLRGWMEGDWMVPLGMKGRKKLSDLFVDLKWSVPEKEAAIIAANGPHVHALLCKRIDNGLRVGPETVSVIKFVFL